MYKLSIITINYNDRVGLEKTLNSVINQVNNQIEYLVIDGASTDGSVQLIEDNSERIDYWISEPDNGIYHAMNKGISQAKGEFLIFLNSGDYFENNVLQKVFSFDFFTAPIVHGNMIKVFENKFNVTDKGFQGGEITLWDMFSSTINHSSCFIKKELFSKYGNYDENYDIVSDWSFFLKVVGLNGVKVDYHDLDISYFDMTGISNSNIGLRNIEREKELEKALPRHLYQDYMFFRSILPESKIYRKIRKQNLLWQILRIYNKIFKNSLW